MKYVSNIAHHPQRVVIEERIRILEFNEEFGLKATKGAFRVSRSTLFVWKQKLKQGGGKLSSLAPGSKAPLNRPKRKLTTEMVSFIHNYRLDHPGVDQVTIKPNLDLFCLKNDYPLVGEATIATVIHQLKKKNQLPDYYIRTTINGKTGRLKYKKSSRSKRKKLRVGDYVPNQPGDLVQIDAITFYLLGIKRYIFTAIDIKTRFAFAYTYKTLSSSTAKDFIQKLERVAPFQLKHIQTDNGKEFHKYFDQYLQTQDLIHFFNYPHSPKMNAYIENFNGLIQRQYVGWHLTGLIDVVTFNQGLMEYLLWYNGEKPHRSIGKLPPLLYYVNNFVQPKKSSMLLDSA